MINLTEFYELEVSEAITQQLRSKQTTIRYEDKLTHTGDYALHECTNYKINDYLTMTQLDTPKALHRQILTDDTVGCVD